MFSESWQESLGGENAQSLEPAAVHRKRLTDGERKASENLASLLSSFGTRVTTSHGFGVYLNRCWTDNSSTQYSWAAEL